MCRKKMTTTGRAQFPYPTGNLGVWQAFGKRLFGWESDGFTWDLRRTMRRDGKALLICFGIHLRRTIQMRRDETLPPGGLLSPQLSPTVYSQCLVVLPNRDPDPRQPGSRDLVASPGGDPCSVLFFSLPLSPLPGALFAAAIPRGPRFI